MIVSWYDLVQLVSKLTLNRVINAVKITLSYIKSRLTKRAEMIGMPLSLSIEPTTSCNLRCPECPSGLRSFTRPTGMLDTGLFSNLIEEIAPTTSYLTFYFQGEPYLNPNFLEMVKIASDHNIYSATSTNAHYLNDQAAEATVKSGLNRLIISIDGTSQETYEQYRVGGKLDKVLEGTNKIIEWKQRLKSKTPVIVWQFLVVRPNEHQIDKVKQMAREYSVDKVALKTAQIYDYVHGSFLIPSDQKYSRYQKLENGTYAIKNKLLDHCWKMWSSCVITWDGQVVPCCFDKDAQHALGKVGDRSFSDVWNSNSYRQFRTTVINSRSEVEMCKNCTEGSKIWA